MPNKIPAGIAREHIVAASRDLDGGVRHAFGESTGYDVLFEGRRYAPKAVVGLAASKISGTPLGPYDFKAGGSPSAFAFLKQMASRSLQRVRQPFPTKAYVIENK